MFSETVPEVHNALVEGRFAVKRTPGCFKAVGVDIALDQTTNISEKFCGHQW